MKKALLFALLGAILLFVWQFLSWAMPAFHKNAQEFTPVQTEVLDAIEKSGLEEGMYYLGQPDPELSGDAYKNAMEELLGQPWAILNYQEVNEDKMVMNMIRGFIMLFFVSLIFFGLVLQQKDPTLMKRIFLGLGIGLIGFMFFPYTNFIWFKEPDVWAYMLDATVPWIFLGWIGHKMA